MGLGSILMAALVIEFAAEFVDGIVVSDGAAVVVVLVLTAGEHSADHDLRPGRA